MLNNDLSPRKLITVLTPCFRMLKNNYFGEKQGVSKNKGCPKIWGNYSRNDSKSHYLDHHYPQYTDRPLLCGGVVQVQPALDINHPLLHLKITQHTRYRQGFLLTGLDTASQHVILWLISCRKTDQHPPISNRYCVSMAKRKRSRKLVSYCARSFVLLLFVIQFLQERYCYPCHTNREPWYRTAKNLNVVSCGTTFIQMLFLSLTQSLIHRFHIVKNNLFSILRSVKYFRWV